MGAFSQILGVKWQVLKTARYSQLVDLLPLCELISALDQADMDKPFEMFLNIRETM